MFAMGDPVVKAKQRFIVQYYYYYALDTSDGSYLHFSGSGKTSKLEYAWAGTEPQFECLKSRAHDCDVGKLNKFTLVSVKAHGISDMGFQSQKENLEDFFNE